MTEGPTVEKGEEQGRTLSDLFYAKKIAILHFYILKNYTTKITFFLYIQLFYYDIKYNKKVLLLAALEIY